MKKILSLLICALMLTSVFPLNAFAEEKVYSFTAVPTAELPSNDELFAAYTESLFYPQYAVSTWGIAAREQLSSADKAMYDWLKENIALVANGSRTKTYFTADSFELASWGVDVAFSSDALNKFIAQFNFTMVADALIYDCPYEFYWFDKTSEYGANLAGSDRLVTSLEVVFQVESSYQSANYSSSKPTVDSGISAAPSKAVANAQAIADKYADLSDYEKLCAYRDEICSLVSYNYDVAESSPVVYGDPWQLIYVFDGDSTTNVVCEGYSKAFQYLCDISEFSHNEIVCYSVSGNTNSQGHMWNIITMPDGNNYLADITNSDAGTVGQNGGLFLNGVSGSIAEGYVAELSQTVTYTYYSDTKTFWGVDSASILNLSAVDYDPEAIHIAVKPNSTIEYDGEPVTIGDAEGDICYSLSGNGNINDYNVSFEWFCDTEGTAGDKLSDAPVNAGDYWVKLTFTNKTDSSEAYSESCKFTVEPIAITIENVSLQSKIYDGSTAATVTSIQYGGVLSGDFISISLDGITAEFLTADAGLKEQAKLTDIIITGEDEGNYYFDSGKCVVDINGETYIYQAESSVKEIFVNGSYDVSETDASKFAFTVEPIEGAEYRMDNGEWQDSNLFDLIEPNSAHIFYARIKETSNVKASDSGSISLSFNKLNNYDSPILAVDVKGDSGNIQIIIYTEEGAEYSFDGGKTWQDGNVLTIENNAVVECGIRYKESATHNASLSRTNNIDTAEYINSAVDEKDDYILGDINNSESVDMTDYILAKRAYFGTYTLNDGELKRGDVNESGNMDMTDYILIKRVYFGTYSF